MLCLTGVLMISFSLPYVFSVLVNSLKWIVSLSNDSKTFLFIKAMPGMVCFSMGFGFLFAHFAILSFAFPLFVSSFFANFNVILTFFGSVLLFTLITVAMVVKMLEISPKKKRNVTGSTVLEIERSFSGCYNIFEKIITKNKTSAILGFIVAFICSLSISIGSHLMSRHCLSQNNQIIENVSEAFQKLGRFRSNKTLLSVMTWNILFSHSLNGRDNLPCVGRVLDIIHPHAIGLQETEGLFPYFGGKDIQGYLSRFIDYDYYPAAELSTGIIGTSLLTELNVNKYRGFVLPRDKERRLPRYSMIKLNCVFHKKPIEIITVHAVYKNWTLTTKGRSPFAYLSEKHMRFLISQAGNATNTSTIIMGDFNLNPDEPELDILKNAGFRRAVNNKQNQTSTLHIGNKTTIIDHIFYRGVKLRASRIFTEASVLSDHYPVVAFFDIFGD